MHPHPHPHVHGDSNRVPRLWRQSNSTQAPDGICRTEAQAPPRRQISPMRRTHAAASRHAKLTRLRARKQKPQPQMTTATSATSASRQRPSVDSDSESRCGEWRCGSRRFIAKELRLMLKIDGQRSIKFSGRERGNGSSVQTTTSFELKLVNRPPRL